MKHTRTTLPEMDLSCPTGTIFAADMASTGAVDCTTRFLAAVLNASRNSMVSFDFDTFDVDVITRSLFRTIVSKHHNIFLLEHG